MEARGGVKCFTQGHPVGQRQGWDLNPGLSRSSNIALLGDVLLSSDAANLPNMVKKKSYKHEYCLIRDPSSSWPQK